MELPIYQENLRSSGDWLTGLSQAREAWAIAKSHPETSKYVREWQSQLFGPEALRAAQLISTWATEADAKLEAAHLLELNRALTNDEPLFREIEAVPLNAAHDPPLARIVPRLLDNAMGWFATEGFAQMNPVEQATLVHLRLLDLQPFAAANFATAALAASFYIQRAGLPPLLFDPNEARYAAALESGFRMLTQHLVDYFAECLRNTLITSNPKSKILMPDFEIKQTTIDDIPVILSFIQKLADYEKLSHEVVATEAGLREVLFGERRYAETVIAYHQNRPVGFALFFHNFSTFLGKPGIYLEDLFVDPEQRGKGFGKALLVYLARLAQERNCGRFEWSVLDWNEPSIKFYESLGAVPLNEWTMYRLTGEALQKLAQEQ